MVKLLYGMDVIDGLKQLEDESIHCCVTSPPYWGLRSYGVDGQLGLEKTPEEYVKKMVEVFQEVKRVLRKDGTLWLNLGDSYSGSMSTDKAVVNPNSLSGKSGGHTEGYRKEPRGVVAGLKPKDLCGIPWRVSFALQADGWYLRSDIIWSKPNPMPESVTDRPTKAHEYVFLLTKSPKYYYDAEAIKEPFQSDPEALRQRVIAAQKARIDRNCLYDVAKIDRYAATTEAYAPTARNKRTVWEIPTEPYPEAHFATYPMELVKLCILAGMSAKGCCEKCGKPIERVVEHKNAEIKLSKRALDKRAMGLVTALHGTQVHLAETKTIGWQSSCKCNSGTTPCIVLDPFSGSGTTGEVATGLGRSYIGIDLNMKYLELAKKRIGLFVFDSMA